MYAIFYPIKKDLEGKKTSEKIKRQEIIIICLILLVNLKKCWMKN